MKIVRNIIIIFCVVLLIQFVYGMILWFFYTRPDPHTIAKSELRSLYISIQLYLQDSQNYYPSDIEKLYPYLHDDAVEYINKYKIKLINKSKVHNENSKELIAITEKQIPKYPSTHEYFCIFGLRGWPSKTIPPKYYSLSSNGDIEEIKKK